MTQQPASAPARPSAWNLPNLLTVLRIALVPLVGWLLLTDNGANPAYRVGALAVFLLALATDRVDGELARRRGQVTNFGKIADPIADKALLGMTFVALSMLGEVWWWVTALVLSREIGITIMRFVVIRHGVMPAGRGGKLKTTVQAFALGMLILPAWSLPFAAGWRQAAYAVLVLVPLLGPQWSAAGSVLVAALLYFGSMFWCVPVSQTLVLLGRVDTQAWWSVARAVLCAIPMLWAASEPRGALTGWAAMAALTFVAQLGLHRIALKSSNMGHKG